MVSSDIKDSIQAICITAERIATEAMTPTVQEKALAILNRELDLLEQEILSL